MLQLGGGKGPGTGVASSPQEHGGHVHSVVSEQIHRRIPPWLSGVRACREEGNSSSPEPGRESEIQGEGCKGNSSELAEWKKDDFLLPEKLWRLIEGPLESQSSTLDIQA